MTSPTTSKVRILKLTNTNKAVTADGLFDRHFELIQVSRTNRNISCCKYSDNRELIIFGCQVGTIELLNKDTHHHFGTLYDRKSPLSPITKITHKNCLKQNKSFLCSDIGGNIKCWNQETKKMIYNIQAGRPILGLTYHPVESEFLALGDDGILSLYDENTSQVIHSFEQSYTVNTRDGHSDKVFSGK